MDFIEHNPHGAVVPAPPSDSPEHLPEKTGGFSSNGTSVRVVAPSSDHLAAPQHTTTAIAPTSNSSTTVPVQNVTSSSTLQELGKAVQDVKKGTEVVLSAVEQLLRSTRACRTMAALRALDTSGSDDSAEIAAAFCTSLTSLEGWEQVNGGTSKDVEVLSRPILLNDNPNPKERVRLFIPADDATGTSATSIMPTIIPAGTRLRVLQEKYTVPNRTPTAEENRQVRMLIREAFEAHYGREKTDEWLPTIISEEEIDKPITAKDLQPAFSKATAYKEPEDEKEEVKLPPQPSETSKLTGFFDEHPSLYSSNDPSQRHTSEATIARSKVDSSLSRAFWHSGETVARGISSFLGAALGGTVGMVSGVDFFVFANVPAGLRNRDAFADDVGKYAGTTAKAVTEFFGTIGEGLGHMIEFPNTVYHRTYAAVSGSTTTDEATSQASGNSIPGRIAGNIAGGIAGGLTGLVVVATVLPAGVISFCCSLPAGIVIHGVIGAKWGAEYFNPGAALTKTKEAFDTWLHSKEKHAAIIEEAIEALKNAQQADEQSIAALEELSRTIAPVSATKPSSTPDADLQAIPWEVLRAQIEARIAKRAEVIAGFETQLSAFKPDGTEAVK